MKVKELIEKLNEMDLDANITIVKQIDSEYQSFHEIAYFNEKHPLGGVCLHIKDQKDNTSNL